MGGWPTGPVWTLPVVLPVPAETLAGGPERLALSDPAGTVLAVVDVEEVHDPDPAAEAKHVFETDDPAYPGVAATLARPGPLVGGPVHVLRLPGSPAGLGPRLTPAVRAMLERGELPPPELSRPEVARVLVDGYRAASKG